MRRSSGSEIEKVVVWGRCGWRKSEILVGSERVIEFASRGKVCAEEHMG